MAQTTAHLVDRVIPPVPVRQWVISVPKRLRCFLGDRPEAVTALTSIFLEEIERLLCHAAGASCAGNDPPSAQPRLGAVSFLHRFGSALNRHVHLHACVTDGVFAATDSPDGVAFHPARPISPADLATLTEGVRRRLIRWFRLRRLIDAEAGARGTGTDCCAAGASPSHDTSRIAWAKLLARIGEHFPLECPKCGGDIRLIAFITEPGPIRRILEALGEPLEPPPLASARGPPADFGEIVQVHDDRDVVQASHDDLPVIDIHSL